MGNDRTPLTEPQQYTFTGIFDPDYVYSALKKYLEEGKAYDSSEKKVEEKRVGDELEIDIELEMELHATDHIHYIITLEIEMKGTDAIVVDKLGVEHRYIDGTAYLNIYSFLILNDNNHRHGSFFTEFFARVYDKYYNTGEMAMLTKKGKKDVADTITRFKQLTNMSTQRR